MKFFTKEQIEKIRKGYYSAVYFNRTKQILLNEQNTRNVTMQLFQKQDNATVCGIEVVSELLKEAVGYYENEIWVDKSSEITLEALKDGEITNSRETVAHIKGPYVYFAHLESVYLGILARLTKIATNTKSVVESANGKPVLFFADRFDLFVNQELDGIAAKMGGVTGVATPAQAHLLQIDPSGTIPHALIAVSNGSTIEAAEKFTKNFPDSPLIVLVDFENDCVKTSLEIAKHFKDKLWGVRLDTSEQLIDKSLENTGMNHLEGQNPKQTHGVTPQLVRNVRFTLNENGFEHVKIVVSGGFNKQKIEMFEKEKTPVDVYGVGSSLLKGNIDFTADIVKVEAEKIAKVGREYKPSKKLQVIDIK